MYLIGELQLEMWCLCNHNQSLQNVFFPLLNASFNSQRDSTLQDYLELSLMLQYNRVTDADICDILVSCDGTWPNSSFSSLFGALFVIAYKTGNEGDYTVLSKHCPQ